MGSGFKNFVAGQVLSEDDLDLYLMRQTVMTFASSTARNTALSGVLDEGMYAFLEDTNRLTVYDGADWQVVSSPWAAYTPTLTAGTLGNGTLDFRYQYAGYKTVHVRGTWVLGSTSAISGLLGFTYPDSVSPDSAPRSIGHVWMLDNTGNDFTGVCQSASSIFVYTAAVAATSATVPFTWATDDAMSIDIIFEIA